MNRIPVAQYRMVVAAIVYEYGSKNGDNVPPQNSITARASYCSDRDCDFTSENKLNASVPLNDHPKNQKVPCLLIEEGEAFSE